MADAYPTTDESPDLKRMVEDAAPVQAIVDAVQLLGPVPEGGIVAISDIGLDPSFTADLTDELVAVSGHKRFVLLLVPPEGRVGVFGAEDLADALGRLAQNALLGTAGVPDEFVPDVVTGPKDALAQIDHAKAR